MFDPNWFYSTIAQSSAAIIGLVGAFIVTKSISVAGERRQLMSQIEAAELESKVLRVQIEPLQRYVREEDIKQDLKEIERFIESVKDDFEDEPEKMNFEEEIKKYQKEEDIEINDVELARKKFYELKENLIGWKATGIKQSLLNWPTITPYLLSTHQYNGPSQYRIASDEIYEVSNRIYLLDEKAKFLKTAIDALPTTNSFKPVISGLILLSILGLIIPVVTLIFQGNLATALQTPIAALFIWALFVNYKIAEKEIKNS